MWSQSEHVVGTVLAGAVLLTPLRSAAEETAPWWIAGAQVTSINQVNTRVSGGPFNPDLSFGTEPSYGWSLTASLFGAVSPWRNGVLVLMPEYANGRGLPNASGLGGYPNGDIVRVPALGKEPYIARAFYHQDFRLSADDSGEAADFEGRFMPAGLHALGAGRASSRVEFTVGKFAANDFFDVSALGSDPRHHFMNWALMENGAWDYAADTRGYTWGVVVAYETPRFAVRGGIATMPTTANGPDFDWDLAHHRSEMLEGEIRHTAFGQPGTVKLLLFANHAHMGRYQDALDRGGTPDIHAVERVGALKYGAGLLVDQQIAEGAVAFARIGWNDGHTETFAFTEIDRSASIGAEWMGIAWRRPKDRLGLAVAASGLSRPHLRYLSAGGQGFQLGDGALTYGVEALVELTYLVHITRFIEITADTQGVLNPGMNAMRGPAAVFGLRLHAHY
jgi:high affinity Mn2+ porin